MKKIVMTILLSIFSLSSLQADVVDNKINEVKAVIQKQDMIASAIDMYISIYGTLPTNIATLQSANMLGATFTYSGTISVNGATKTITLTDTITAPETYQTDYYNNTNDKEKYSVHSVSGSSFKADYPFNSKATYTYLIKSTTTAVVSPTAPASPTNGMLWLNTLTKQFHLYSGGTWGGLNVRKLWIVRDTTELPSSASANDGAIVLKTTSLTKYLYVNGSWQTIPQTIPFTYNGAF